MEHELSEKHDLLNEEERTSSPDLFAASQASSSSNGEISESKDELRWRGVNMRQIYHERGPWSWEPPPIQASFNHTVLFNLVEFKKGHHVPHISSVAFCWDHDHVRMPFSNENLYPVDNENGRTLKRRWDLIVESLMRPIHSSEELQKVIFLYNHKYTKRWNFAALHRFFIDVLDEEETEAFFKTVMPKIVALALRLPDLLPCSVPLLKRNRQRSVSLTQLQIASLLANAFLCTFPRRNTTRGQAEFASYPDINFNRLFKSITDTNENDSVSEKLKCIFNYFRRVTNKDPDGVVTFERRFMKLCDFPQYGKSDKHLSSMHLHITDKGTIDEDGIGLLQVDFANKYIGGGVLGHGCVQEEIRFVLCPELIVSRLFTEELQPTEALLVTGVEQYNSSKGYADTFVWHGDYVDQTPRDNYGRKKCYLVAIDALRFVRPSDQYKISDMLRELNKAYVGYFSPSHTQPIPAVATGNWGCGVFKGDPYLKTILQLIAIRLAGRDMVYYTFGDKKLRDKFYKFFTVLCDNNITVGQLWNFLLDFSRSQRGPNELYPYIFQSISDLLVPKTSNSLGIVPKRKRDFIDAPGSVSDKIPRKPSSSQSFDELLNTDIKYFETDFDLLKPVTSEPPNRERNFILPVKTHSNAAQMAKSNSSVLLSKIKEMEELQRANPNSDDGANSTLHTPKSYNCVIEMDVDDSPPNSSTSTNVTNTTNQSSTSSGKSSILKYFKPQS